MKIKDSVAYVRRNPKAAAVALVLFIMLTMLTNIVSSCSLILEGISSSIAGSTYPSDDADMFAAEAEYCAMEAQLQSDMNHYEDNHDYDEYSFELDSIGHDPYVLISTLTAMYDGAWTIDEVRGTLRMLFERQYTLTENVSSTTIHNPENPEAEPQEYRMAHLKDGAEYEGLYHAARCRAKADWLVGINATRFFTLVYHHTLKIGRVMSPTLALIVQREAEICAFTPEPFFTVQLDLNPTVFSEKLKSFEEAEALAGLCKGKVCTIRQITRKQKFEPAPKLYDLTTLQREANRVLGYTAQQTLDYAQSLYQQKLCTYPRTDSRYLTDDMEPRVPEYVAVAAKICGADVPAQINAAQVCDSSKVSDHFALIPTLSCTDTALASVPAGERELLKLVALSVLRAVSGPYVTEETEVLADCEGRTFTTKGHTLADTGWRKYVEGEAEGKPLPALMEGQQMAITGTTVKEGKTSAPKRYTEAALLAGMESAGIGTPATRAEIIEKLISAGYMERKKTKKTVQLIPTPIGSSLITVLPEQLQSPELTAEWEKRLSEVERGELSPEDFDADVESMISDLVRTYKPVNGSEVLFLEKGAAVGKCPRCGFPVEEREKGFFCRNPSCNFYLWKENSFFTRKHKSITSAVAEALLNDGKVFLKDCYSEKKGKSYDATILLDDDGERTSFRIAF